jgi:hypothetical protein
MVIATEQGSIMSPPQFSPPPPVFIKLFQLFAVNSCDVSAISFCILFEAQIFIRASKRQGTNIQTCGKDVLISKGKRHTYILIFILL